MASAVQTDKKYDEGVYRHKKQAIDTSDIIIEIGNKLYMEDIYYGTIVRESEIFYYIETYLNEVVEFMKDSVLDKIANKRFRLVD